MMKRFVLIFIVFGGLFVSKVHAQLIYQTSDVQKKYYINEGNFGIMSSTTIIPSASEPSTPFIQFHGSNRAIPKITSNHTFYFAADYLNGDVAGTHPRMVIQKAPPHTEGGTENEPTMPDFTPLGDGIPFILLLLAMYMAAIVARRYHTKHRMQ